MGRLICSHHRGILRVKIIILEPLDNSWGSARWFQHSAHCLLPGIEGQGKGGSIYFYVYYHKPCVHMPILN